MKTIPQRAPNLPPFLPLIVGLFVVAAGFGAASGATIGVLRLSDARQLPNLSLLDPAMSAAKNALVADGHVVSQVSAITAASFTGLRILWLPLLDSEASYTSTERAALRAFFDGGGRIFWIGDAGIYNAGDDSFLSAFGITKLAQTFDTAGPVLATQTHPVVTGPFGALSAAVATSASFGLMQLDAASVSATAVYTDSAGPGAFVALLKGAGAASGRAALVADSSIFADALDESGSAHRVLLRNLTAWLADEPGYTPADDGMTSGMLTEACDACLGVSVVITPATTTGLTSVVPLGNGAAQCGFQVEPFASLSQKFVGFGFTVSTTAGMGPGGQVAVTVHYSDVSLDNAGLRDRSALSLFRYDAASNSAIDVTTARYAAGKAITGTAAAGGAFLLGAAIPATDCDGNSVPDVCEIDADSVAPGGPYYCTLDCDNDCNENGIPDPCDVRARFTQTSPTLSPIGVGSPQTHVLTGVPRAVAGVAMDFSASGDFSAASEYIDVRLNGTLIGRVFDTSGSDCSASPISKRLTIPKDTFNTLVNGGTATLLMTASSAVDPNLCPSATYIQVHVDYDCVNGERDCNDNGVPDECESLADCDGDGTRDLCEIAHGGELDCNGNGVPDSCDIASETSEDCNANEIPDDCEGPIRITVTRDPATGGAVQPNGGADHAVCDTVAILATPAAGYCFAEWLVNVGAPVADAAAPATSVTADQAKTVTGRFKRIIATEPTPVTACPGGEARITVGVDASLADVATYQWRRNGENVTGPGYAGAASNELVVSPVTNAQAGLYDCVVTVPCGVTTSVSALLTVGNDVVIETHPPATISSCLNGTVVLGAVASGSGVTYQWQFAADESADFANLINEPGRVGATSASMTLSSLTAVRAGIYRCAISGACGSTLFTTTTTLVVGSAPTVSTATGNEVVCEGDSFTARVVATGTDLSYAWYFNGGTIWMPLEDNADGVSGAHTEELSLAHVVPSQTGSYRCSINGFCAPTVSSSAVTVTVRPTTRVLEQPSSVSRCPGQTANFSVSATGSNLTYRWQFDGSGEFTDIAPDALGHSGILSDHLTLAGINPAHAGHYRCIVSGACGTAEASAGAELHVSSISTWTNSSLPSDVASCPGGRVVFSVAAVGENLTYQWQANTGPAFISLTNGPAVSGAQSPELVLTGVTVSQAGRYQCVVLGACGAALVSREAVLTITHQVCDCNANLNSDAEDIVSGISIDCNANGIPDECEIIATSTAPGEPFFCTAGCLADCNGNGHPDACDIGTGQSADCDANGVPDECQTPGGTGGPGSPDCNGNGSPDACDIAAGVSEDCNHNGIPDECEPPFVVDAGEDIMVCAGQATVTLGAAVVASGSKPPYSYAWRIAGGPAGAELTGATSAHPVFHATQPGEYTTELSVADSSVPPCVKVDQVNLHVYAMTVDAGASVSVGIGRTTAPFSPVVNGAVGEVNYEWRIETGSPDMSPSQFGGGINAPHPTFTPSQPGRYTLRVTVRDSNSPASCEAFDTLTVDSMRMTLSTPDDFSMCADIESPPLTVSVSSGGTPPMSYTWQIVGTSPDPSLAQFGGSGPTTNSPTFRPTAPGLYTLRVTVTDSSQPPAVAQADLRVSANHMQIVLPTEVAHCRGSSGVPLPRPEIAGGVEPYSYLWTIEPESPSDAQSQFSDESAFDAAWRFRPSVAGRYSLRLTVTDSAGPACVESALLVFHSTDMTADAGADFVTQAFQTSRPLGSSAAVGTGSAAAYSWRVLNGPSTAASQLSATTLAQPTFTPADVGTYALEFTAIAGGCSATDVVVVDAIARNRALPVNSEGRLFMSLRIDEPYAAAEWRVADAPPGQMFTGTLQAFGDATDRTGLATEPRINRRLSVAMDAPTNAATIGSSSGFIAVVAMLFDAGESDGNTLRIHAWDDATKTWRRATGGSLEKGMYPARATRDDVGRSGVTQMQAVGDNVYVSWAIVNYTADFALGISSEDIAPFEPIPGGGDPTQGNELPPAVLPTGLCGTGGGAAMESGLLLVPVLCIRLRRRSHRKPR